MIGRMWRARTRDVRDADAYEDVFRTEVLAELGAVYGFRGAYLLRRDEPSGSELVTLTLFDSIEDVRGFAGPDYQRANVSAPARAVLADFDQEARHFTVVVAP